MNGVGPLGAVPASNRSRPPFVGSLAASPAATRAASRAGWAIPGPDGAAPASIAPPGSALGLDPLGPSEACSSDGGADDARAPVVATLAPGSSG